MSLAQAVPVIQERLSCLSFPSASRLEFSPMNISIRIVVDVVAFIGLLIGQRTEYLKQRADFHQQQAELVAKSIEAKGFVPGSFGPHFALWEGVGFDTKFMTEVLNTALKAANRTETVGAETVEKYRTHYRLSETYRRIRFRPWVFVDESSAAVSPKKLEIAATQSAKPETTTEEPAKPVSDDQISKTITEKLSAEKKAGHLKDSNIELEMDDGSAWLSGTVSSERDRTIALEIARRVKGVKQVVNDLSIGKAVNVDQR